MSNHANALGPIFALVKADFLERTRRYSFLVTLCLVIYLGYAVNTGQVLILLGSYRGVYNSAWVGSLMALVITFFLGLTGFFLVKGAVRHDEHSGVGQIIATTPLSRARYLLGKWLSNLTLLSVLILILALAALLMQTIQREAPQVQPGALLAPILLVAWPMMALVAGLAVLFESVRWLRGGFGNMVYFGIFILLFFLGVQLAAFPALDVTGMSLIGPSMKAAAGAAFADYDGGLMLGMNSGRATGTFVWNGVDWSFTLALGRLAWVPFSAALAAAGSIFFDRFDPTLTPRALRREARRISRKEPKSLSAAVSTAPESLKLTPLTGQAAVHANFLRLLGLEFRLLVKGMRWYMWLGMAALWLASAFYPAEALRKYFFMLAMLWPVLIWSKMGQRAAAARTGQLLYPAPRAHIRLLLSEWLAGVLLTALPASGILPGRWLAGQPLDLYAWALGVAFIPTLALALGACSGGSRLFELVYPVWWYLGPFNPDNGLAHLDYLGLHAGALSRTHPVGAAAFVLLCLLAAWLARVRPRDSF